MDNISQMTDYWNYTYSMNESYDSILKLPVHMIVVYGIAYGLIFLSAVIGNVMVVIVVLKTPRMHTVTNLFIANLAVADILVAVFGIPMTFLDNIYTGWPFGAVLCKMTSYIQGVSVCASVYNLCAIAVDRFLAICIHPRWRIMKRGALVMFCLIWLLSVTLMLPWAIYTRHYPWDGHPTTTSTTYICQQRWPDYDAQRIYFVVAVVVGTYLFPLTVVFLCYILIAWRVWHRKAPGVAMGNLIIRRCKINVVKMLITVVLMFALSWLPLHVLFLILHFNPPADKAVVARIQDIGVPLAQWLELSNSGMNAFIYSFFSGNFRRGFLYLWYCITGRRNTPTGNYESRRITRTASEDSATMARYTVQRSEITEVPNGNRVIRHAKRLPYSRCYLNKLSQTSFIDAPSWPLNRSLESIPDRNEAFV